MTSGAPPPKLPLRCGRALAFACLLVLAPTLGCEPTTRYRVLTMAIDGVPAYEEWLDPPPLAKRPGRRVRTYARYREPPPVVKVKADLPTGSAGLPTTWEDLVAALPEDADGEIDWMVAITEGLIKPTNVLPPDPFDDEQQTDEIPDFELGGEDDPDELVVFSHTAHTYWLTCDNCHPFPFEDSAGSMDMSMDQISDGEGCGLCHNSVAFSDTGCGRCHPALAEDEE